MLNKLAIGATAAAMLSATAASAFTATAATDLNLRAGPGSNQQIVGVIPGNSQVTVAGCLDTANWCRVNYNGQEGWAYGDYLAANMNGEMVAVYPNRVELGTTVVVEDEMAREKGALGVGTMGAIIGGAAVGGPAGAVVGGIIGMAAGAAITPEERMVTYVKQHPVEPVFVQGEIVTGATIPEVVSVYPLPQSQWAYTNVNGRYVIVDPNTREIKYIAKF